MAAIADHRPELGRRGEEHAAAHLERLGYTILARNHRTRYGELDLVAAGPQALVFVEVKTRRAGGRWPLESVREAKQRQVRRMASAWLAEPRSGPHRRELRFDAIGVTLDVQGRLVTLEHLEAAF